MQTRINVHMTLPLLVTLTLEIDENNPENYEIIAVQPGPYNTLEPSDVNENMDGEIDDHIQDEIRKLLEKDSA